MNAFTVFHVALSLVGIFTGFVIMFDMVGAKLRTGWTAAFLWTTLATSVTGFMFPFKGFTPALGFGGLSVVLLAVSFYALHAKKLTGGWRLAYGITAVIAEYLNFFVLIVQSFLKIPALKALAPTQQEPPFAIAQGAGLVLFLVWGTFALRRFRVPPPARPLPAPAPGRSSAPEVIRDAGR